MSCEFYERLAAGPLGRLLKERGDRFFKVVKLLAGAVPFVSSLAEVAELVADLSKPGLAGELVELIKTARDAGQCDEEAKKAVEKLGVSEDWLRTLAKNLAALPEVDLRQLEERAQALERGFNLLKQLSPHIIDLGQIFEVKGDRLLVKSPFGPVEYVEVGVEGRVREALTRGRVVVVYGPRGVGKSTTALKAIYDFAKSQPGRVVVVVRVGENWRDAPRVVAQLRDGLFVPVLYYDTLEVKAYRRRDEGVDVRYSFMAHVKPLADFLYEVAPEGMPTVVVLAEEDYRAYEDAVKAVGAEAVRLGGEAETLVKGILRDVPDTVAEAVLEKYKGEFYAVAAALAKALYEKWRDTARVVDAVKRLDVYSLALAYLWHVVLGGDEAVARRAAPLILATGFFGPHPPKLAKAVVEAVGEELEDAVVRWFSQPLHGTLYETIRKVARGAVYRRRFKVGSDELCEGKGEKPCRLVEICSEILVRVPRKRYSSIEEVAEEYATFVAKALEAPGPHGMRQIDLLIDDFLQAHNGVAEDGRWRIRYETKGSKGVEVIEDVIDEVDVLSALYGLAVVPVWNLQLLKPLEEWFFIGSEKVEVIGLYLFLLLKERGEELAKRAVAIVNEMEKRGFYTNIDVWRGAGIVVAGRWDHATDEELEKAMRLVNFTLTRFSTFSYIVLDHFEFLLSEAWRRVTGGGARKDRERRQRLADSLAAVVKSATIGYLFSIPFLFVVGVDRPDCETLAKRFATLYKVASNVAKLHLLDTLLYMLDWDINRVNIVAMLLGTPQLEQEEVFEELIKRVETFVSSLNDIERAYAVASLYPLIAVRYATLGAFANALKFAEESLKALAELWKAYEEDKKLTEEKLQPYLKQHWIILDLKEELNKLSRHVYYHLAHVYMDSDKISKAVEYAEKACELAKKLGDVHDEVVSCGLLPRLKAVKEGVPPVEEFEKGWQRALQAVGLLGVEAFTAVLGEYAVALASAGRLSDVGKVLEEWGRALKLFPIASALTYGVLSLFDDQHLERAMEHFPEWARTNLLKFVSVLQDVIETGLFAKDPEIVKLARKTLMIMYYKEEDVKKTFSEITNSDKLFLSALVGLVHCKKSNEWGLKLARVAALAGSRFGGTIGRLYDELYKALEGVSVENCITDQVLRAVYKLYYDHV